MSLSKEFLLLFGGVFASLGGMALTVSGYSPIFFCLGNMIGFVLIMISFGDSDR